MKSLFILIFICINPNLSSVRGDFFDITTAYKFNVEEESDVNGNTITTYLDTCEVVVHVQNNAVGLPYLNVKNTSSNQIIYPLIARSIPDETQWKTLNADGTLKSLSSELLLVDIDNIELFNYVKNASFFSFVNHKFSVLYEAKGVKEHSYYDEYFRPVYYYKYNFDLTKFNVLSNNFLFLENKKENIKDYIKFSLKHQDEYYQSVVVSIVGLRKRIEICYESSTRYSYLKCTSYAYADDAENQISILMTLKDELRIYDLIGRKVFTFPFKGPYNRIEQSSTTYTTPITYKIINVPQKVISSDQTITTPSFHDIRNSTNLLIVHFTKSAGNITAHLKEENTENVIQLKKEEQIVMKSGKNDPNNVNELVLTKFKVRFPHNWTKTKQIQITADKGVYIMKMWEGGDLEKYRIHENKTCVKNTIGEIYDMAIIEPKQGKQIASNTTCLNGGFPDQYKETCVCSPGFTGDSCELACGRNYYGHECSNLCSTTDTECKGIILCTPSYGCSCAPGYYGDKCLQQCEEGRYGADCKQSCGQCKHGCDKYTGNCIGECVNAYLVRPTCREYHSYWKESPKAVNSSFNSVRLSLNFDLNNIVQSSVETQFFMVQYRENVETYWNNCSYETFRPTVTEYEVENLKPGRKYLFRVILIAQSLETNNPEQCQISETLTKCKVSEIMDNLNVTKVTNTSISLAWNKETAHEENTECPFTSYLLEIEETRDDYVEKRKIMNIKSNFYVIKSLTPDQTYFIKLKKFTVHGESSVVSSTKVSTQKSFDDSMNVAGVIIKKIGSDIHLQWFGDPRHETHYIKYKLIKHLSCSSEALESPLNVISTPFTNYTLHLEPNSQYQIFVTVDKTEEINENNQTIVTNGKLPMCSPSILKQRFRTTNESVQLYWSDPPSRCIHMNGFFKKYSIEVLDNQNSTLNTYETQTRTLEITGLSPRTEYTIRMRYVNHLGSNPQFYSEHSFTTKATSFLTAQDLVAYKASAGIIGIRWMLLESNSTITGINIKAQNHAEIKSMNITNLTSVQCEAWPSYLCYNITNLKHNTRYTVSVEIFSEEFPEGGSLKSIEVVTRESIPDPVSDIKVVEISDTYVVVSWRIPYLLNGILRKFLIEVEHLSSFDESLCCQTILPINHVVAEEKEIYSHKIENIMNASSYQVTVRAFTRRLGPGVSAIIDVPPPTLPLRKKPKVTVNDEEVVWENGLTEKGPSNVRNELLSDVLVIVRSDDQTSKTNDSSPLTSELQHHLQSKDWWLAHVCSSNEDCSVKIGNEDKSNSSYGEINNKPLTIGDNYTIILTQVNKYLSAKSFTIVKSVKFEMKEKSESISTTTESSVQSTSQSSAIVETLDTIVGDIEHKVVEELLEHPQTEDVIDSTDPPEPLDYDYNNPVLFIYTGSHR